ncbi:glycerol dehydrogenase [Marinobacter sp. 2_MG-2023]|uniref:glycerol dehydrogenase n=1 Tax=Marinobacter sp. 2_MG-2023 TaxID=3062679 RepID=UPI0026E2E65A|nr:glycerol dehydrogenase [Marinobacter sp. 2_MG-2023]MDO6441434.1 glycerol dehydrogenase [Marinobacter sp. 2_MG-2023]
MTENHMKTMLAGCRVFGSPRRYIQGAGALGLLGVETLSLGNRATVICDSQVRSFLEELVLSSLNSASVDSDIVEFDGEVVREAIHDLCEQISPTLPEVIIALGGGKTVDVGKAVADKLGARLIVVPTLASNDAPTSRAVVFYDRDHNLSGVERCQWNPDVILVDTAVIAQAPERFLVAGIGDAIAKRFEADASVRYERNNLHGGRVTQAGLCLASASYEVIRRDGLEACRAVRDGSPNQSLEAVVESCVLLAGLGFENSGLFLAHSLTRGLALFSQTQNFLHGELVAYGLLVQLTQEGRPLECLLDLINFYQSVGLPESLQALGLDRLSPSCLLRMAEATLAAPYMEELRAQLQPAELVSYMVRLEQVSTQKITPSATTQ